MAKVQWTEEVLIFDRVQENTELVNEDQRTVFSKVDEAKLCEEVGMLGIGESIGYGGDKGPNQGSSGTQKVDPVGSEKRHKLYISVPGMVISTLTILHVSLRLSLHPTSSHWYRDTENHNKHYL